MEISLVKNINVNTAFSDHTDQFTIHNRLSKIIKRRNYFCP